MKGFLTRYPKTRLFVMMVSMICGAVILAMSAPLLSSSTATFLQSYSATFSAGGGDAGFQAALDSLNAAIAGAAIMIVACIPGLLGVVFQVKFLIIVFVPLSILGSFVSIIGGGLFMNVPGMFGEKNYLDSRNVISPKLEGLESDLMDFGLAVYNQCCGSRNWTAQALAKECTGSQQADCAAITDPRVRDNLPNAQTLLCMCASSQTKLTAFQDAIATSPDNFCKQAEGALVAVDGLRLPSRAASQSVKALTKKFFNLEYKYIPLVGWYEVPSTNPDGATSLHPFGCGIGYQKGLAFLTDAWFKQHTVGAATAAIALGVVNLAIMFFGVLVATVTTAEEYQESKGKANKWDQVHDVPANYAQTTVPSQSMELGHQQQQQSQHSSNSQAFQIQQPASAAAAYSAPNPRFIAPDTVLFDKVSAFYGKYEPGKSVADVEDVTKWAQANGVDALNAKLQGKYQADLNSIGAADNKGAKALAGDLDL